MEKWLSGPGIKICCVVCRQICSSVMIVILMEEFRFLIDVSVECSAFTFTLICVHQQMNVSKLLINVILKAQMVKMFTE
jgi:hypothetical protein